MPPSFPSKARPASQSSGRSLCPAPATAATDGRRLLDPVPAKVSIRNQGFASLPKEVQIGGFRTNGGTETQVGQTSTTHTLFPGQTQVLSLTLDAAARKTDTFIARILIDPKSPSDHECKEDNNESAKVTPSCVE